MTSSDSSDMNNDDIDSFQTSSAKEKEGDNVLANDVIHAIEEPNITFNQLAYDYLEWNKSMQLESIMNQYLIDSLRTLNKRLKESATNFNENVNLITIFYSKVKELLHNLNSTSTNVAQTTPVVALSDVDLRYDEVWGAVPMHQYFTPQSFRLFLLAYYDPMFEMFERTKLTMFCFGVMSWETITMLVSGLDIDLKHLQTLHIYCSYKSQVRKQQRVSDNVKTPGKRPAEHGNGISPQSKVAKLDAKTFIRRIRVPSNINAEQVISNRIGRKIKNKYNTTIKVASQDIVIEGSDTDAQVEQTIKEVMYHLDNRISVYSHPRRHIVHFETHDKRSPEELEAYFLPMDSSMQTIEDHGNTFYLLQFRSRKNVPQDELVPKKKNNDVYMDSIGTLDLFVNEIKVTNEKMHRGKANHHGKRYLSGTVTNSIEINVAFGTNVYYESLKKRDIASVAIPVSEYLNFKAGTRKDIKVAFNTMSNNHLVEHFTQYARRSTAWRETNGTQVTITLVDYEGKCRYEVGACVIDKQNDSDSNIKKLQAIHCQREKEKFVFMNVSFLPVDMEKTAGTDIRIRGNACQKYSKMPACIIDFIEKLEWDSTSKYIHGNIPVPGDVTFTRFHIDCVRHKSVNTFEDQKGFQVHVSEIIQDGREVQHEVTVTLIALNNDAGRKDFDRQAVADSLASLKAKSETIIRICM